MGYGGRKCYRVQACGYAGWQLEVGVFLVVAEDAVRFGGDI